MASDAPLCVELETMPLSANGALACFSPPVREWFERTFGSPTLAQRLAWPALCHGKSVLVTAPTGSGKTLAAFLPLFDRLARTEASAGMRVLYVAPLRALTNDIHANLTSYLDGIWGSVGATGWPPSETSVTNQETEGRPTRATLAIRTGDTTPRERRLLLKCPPDVLLTTPESLALMLAHPQSHALFGSLQTVVVDEVHQLADNKRGVDLALSMERLERIAAGPLQRIGLSATCCPVQEIAQWLVGVGRDVTIAATPDAIRFDLHIEHLNLSASDNGVPGYVPTLLEKLIPLLQRNRTTLIFTNLRSIAERLTWSLRKRLPDWDHAIALHHSALGVTVRRDVEARMKRGELRVVLSSTSLELGIDIGAVDQVVLLHPTGGVARLLQRLGRSGHGPGRQRSGVQFTASHVELLEAVATAAAGDATQLDPVRIPKYPLDVLSQQLVGMSMERPWTAAMAWEMVRQAYPYRDLSLADYTDCLAYVSGGHDGMPVPSRVRWVDERFLVRGKKTERIYRTNAGTIFEEDTRQVRSADDGRHLGRVPDAFATRLQPGDRFLLEGRSMEVTHGDADGLKVKSAGGMPTFTRWAGRLWAMPQALAERIWLLRLRCHDAILDGPDRLLQLLQREYCMRLEAAAELAAHVRQQEQHSEIPRHGLFVERTVGMDGWGQLFAFHVPLPTPACEAIARVLAYRLGRSGRFQYVPGWLGFGLTTPDGFDLRPNQLGELLTPVGFRADLERIVINSPALKDRFTRVALVGLMVLRQPLGQRRRVGGRNWTGGRLLNWLRFSEPGFPLLRQALRELAEDIFLVDAAEAYLTQLQSQPIRMRSLREPSPFVQGWRDANYFAYEYWWANVVAPPKPSAFGPEPTSMPLPHGLLMARDWLLTPQRAAIHVPTQTAVIADLHLGYDSARRAGGDALPLFGWHEARLRLEELIARHALKRVVFAGDLVEDGRHAHEVMELLDWLQEQGLGVALVQGNHDVRLRALDGIDVHPHAMELGDWVVRHEADEQSNQPQIVGHVHPKLYSPRVGGKASCYVLAGNTLILPAFSDDAAGVNVAAIRAWRDALTYAIVNDEVWDMGPIRELNEPRRPVRMAAVPALAGRSR